MVDQNAGWAGDRDRMADVADLPVAAWRRSRQATEGFGDRVALPSESAAVMDRRLAALDRELAPRGELARILVRRVAVCSVRLDRAVEREAASLSAKVRRAEADFDEARLTEADHLMGWIGSEPATHHRRLIRMPEGVDRLVATLRGLRHDLQWDAKNPWVHGTHVQILDECTGRRWTMIPASRGQILSEAIGSDFHRLDPVDGAGLTDTERRAWAKEALGQLIDAEVDRLLAHRATLDAESIGFDRAGAAKRATFNPGPDAVLARRYEASTERALYRALRELRAVNAEAQAQGIEPGPSESILAAMQTAGFDPGEPTLASFRAEAQSAIEVPTTGPELSIEHEVAARGQLKAASIAPVLGFVPSEPFSGRADTGSGVRAGRSSRGCSKGSGGRNPR